MDQMSVSVGLAEMAYVLGGLLLPLFYVPQIVSCWRDSGGLASYSISKSLAQVACRLVMMPFIAGSGPALMLFIVGIDFAGRVVELGVALMSLRRCGWTWRDIGMRAVTWDVARLSVIRDLERDLTGNPATGEAAP